ncbi:unnamed protein product [Linum trigynum]|uniref:Uncharacterized protein n=1 Tax=Linum trigynum TaxID=586398 RepID=A0AAV2FJS5_9ROSI
MKLEKLLCLKYRGSISSENSAGDHTTNPVPSSFHDMMLPPSPEDDDDDEGLSSSKSYVFDRNGAGPFVAAAADRPVEVERLILYGDRLLLLSTSIAAGIGKPLTIITSEGRILWGLWP